MSTLRVPPGAVVVGVADAEDLQPVSWAADQAHREGRTLVIVHSAGTLGTPGTVWLSPDAGASEEVTAMRATGEAVLSTVNAFVAEHHPSVATVSLVRLVEPAQALLDVAADASLLVVGSRGRGPLRSRFLGSVGVTLTMRSPVPVVVVRPHHPGLVRKGVLVGVDVTAGSSSTLEFAFREASAHGWPITVMHSAWPADLEFTEPTAVSAEDAPEEWRALTEVTSGLREKYPDVPVELTVLYGPLGDCLVAAAQHRHLVVLGRHDNVGHGRTARALVERSDGPVAVVPA